MKKLETVKMSVQEYCEECGVTAEDVEEMYGKNVVSLYWAEDEKECEISAKIGVEYADGSIYVYGCRQDCRCNKAEMLLAVVKSLYASF